MSSTDNTLDDIDKMMSWGEIALMTLTQLWRSLPRVDTEAGKQLSDDVVAARKAIESLVKAACASHRTLADSVRLYEPLPFGTGGAHHGHSHKSPERGISTLSHVSLSRDDGDYDVTSAVRAAAAGHVTSVANKSSAAAGGMGIFGMSSGGASPGRGGGGGGGDASLNGGGAGGITITTTSYDGIPFDDYDPDSPERKCFSREVRMPNVPHLIFDDPTSGALASELAEKGGLTPLSRMSLMVQFAERREQMWRNHSAHLHARNDREELAEMEVRERYEIALSSAESRERLISQFYCLVATSGADGFDDASSTVSGSRSRRRTEKRTKERLQMLEDLRTTLKSNEAAAESPERKHRALLDKCAQLELERTKLVDEMAKLSSEVTRLSVENSTLMKKAMEVPVGPSPELTQITTELAALRKQIKLQQERSRSVSRTASPVTLLEQQQQSHLNITGRSTSPGAAAASAVASSTINSSNHHTSITINNRQQHLQLQQQQQQSQQQSFSVTSSRTQGAVSSIASPAPKEPTRKVVSRSEAISAVIARQRRRNGGSDGNDDNDAATGEAKGARFSGAISSSTYKNDNNNNNNNSYNIFGSNSGKRTTAGTRGDSRLQQGGGGGGDSGDGNHTLGQYGDDSFVPASVIRAATLYFGKKKSSSGATNNNKSRQRQQQQKKRQHGGSDRSSAGGNQSRSGSSSSSGGSSCGGSSRSSLTESVNHEPERQRRIAAGVPAQEEDAARDPEFAEVERKNRETLQRLKMQLLRGVQPPPSPQAVSISPVPAYQKQNVARNQQQQQQQRPTRTGGAGGSTASKQAVAKKGKPQAAKDATSVGVQEQQCSLGYLKWQYRSSSSVHRHANCYGRHLGRSVSAGEQQQDARRTPPAPALNLVTLAGATEVVRLETEDDEMDEVVRPHAGSSTTNRAASSGSTKQEIKLRSAGRPGAATSSVAVTGHAVVTRSRPTALEVLAASSPERKSVPRSAKLPAAAASSSSSAAAAKRSATTTTATIRSASSLSQQQQRQRDHDESPLRGAFYDAQLQLLESTERAERQNLYGEAAVYFVQRAALMDKEPVDWFSPMSARAQEQ